MRMTNASHLTQGVKVQQRLFIQRHLRVQQLFPVQRQPVVQQRSTQPWDVTAVAAFESSQVARSMESLLLTSLVEGFRGLLW